jgi:hypothetical protein
MTIETDGAITDWGGLSARPRDAALRVANEEQPECVAA